MDWIQLALIATGGASAGLLAAILARLVRKRFPGQWPYLITFIVSFVVLLTIFRIAFIDPLSQKWAQQRAMEALEEYAVYNKLLERHPELRPVIEEAVAEAARDKSRSTQSMQKISHAIIPYFTKYASQAPDAAILEYAKYYSGIFEKLEQKNPRLCLALLRGEVLDSAEADLKEIDIERSAPIIEKIVLGAIENPASAMPAADFEDASALIMDEISLTMALDDLDVTDPMNPEADAKLACEFTRRVLQTVPQSLQTQAPAYLRAMLAMPQ